MQLLCSTGAFSRHPDFTNYLTIQKYGAKLRGADGLELMFYDPWYSSLEEIGRFLQQSGLKFPVMHTEKNIGIALGSLEPAEREQGVRWLELNCQLGQMIGAQILVLHLWGWPRLDEHMEYNLELLTQCLDMAGAHNIKLAIETIPCKMADPLSNVHLAVQKDNRCVVALDTEFLGWHKQLEAVFETNWLWQAERVQHVHIKDYDGVTFAPNGRRRYLQPGEGQIDFASFFRTLHTKGFDGFISLEAPAIDGEGNVDTERLNESLQFLRNMMNGVKRG